MTAPIGNSISVVIVTYESASTIEQCIRSIVDDDPLAQIIVVDNASTDGTIQAVRHSTHGCNDRPAADRGIEVRAVIQVISNRDNRGFAAGCNQGAAVAEGDIVAFLNPDAFVRSGALTALATHLRVNPGIGLIGCRIVDESGRVHGPQRRREPTWRRSFMTLSGLDRFEEHWQMLAGIERAPNAESGAGRQTIVEDVDAVNGALMMLPLARFRQIGGFDEAFTLHAEDLDLCRRIRDVGARVALANDVEIVHVGGVSSRRRPFWVEWQKTRSLWRYFRKHDPASGWIIRIGVAVGLGVRLTITAIVTPLLLARNRGGRSKT
jgi:N-acetylglucosaminyl-diphospho-decaprenol L-rhamnosyltransferase